MSTRLNCCQPCNDSSRNRFTANDYPCGADMRFALLVKLPTLAISTIQTRRTSIHQDDGVGVALVAHRCAGREGEGRSGRLRFSGLRFFGGLAECAGEVVRKAACGLTYGVRFRLFF